MQIRLTLLGEFAIHGAQGDPLPARGKVGMLLAWLARRGPEPVSREELASLFWGDRRDALARQSLRHALLRLRRTVGDDVIRVTPEHVRLEPGTFDSDVAAFELALREDRLEDAVRLWGGDFLVGFDAAGGEDLRLWLESERESLRRRLAWALAQLVARAEAAGDWSVALQHAVRWAEAQPLDETAHITHVRLLDLAGRRSDAQAEHARVMHMLRHVYGVEPGPSLLRLDLASRHGEPAPLRVPLVGRAAAFEALVTAWSDGRGAGVAVLVEGAEFSGRSRMLAEFTSWVASHAPDTLVLQAAAADAADDDAVLAHLLSGLRHAKGLSGAADRDLACVARLVPSIRARFPSLPHVEPTSADEACAMMCDAVPAVLRVVAEEQPVLVVLDDVDAAGGTVRRTLAALSRLAPDGVLVVTAMQSGASGAVQLPRARSVRLQAMEPAATEALLAARLTLPDPQRRSLAGRLHEWSGGLPGIALATVDELVAEGRVRPGGNDAWLETAASRAQPLPLPRAARTRVHERLQSLSPEERAVLDVVAVAGTAAPEQLPSWAATAADSVDAALTRLAALSLIEVAGGRVSVTPWLAAAVLDCMTPLRRGAVERGLSLRHDRTLLQRLRRFVPHVAAALVLVTVTAVAAFQRADGDALPSLAIGEIHDLTEDNGGVGIPLADLLATRLARLGRLDVVSPERMHELHWGLGSGRDNSLAAARMAGARQVVQGSLYARPGGGLRLELRRIDLRTGAVVAGHIIDAMDPVSLVDGAVVEIAAEFGVPSLQTAPERPASLVAYRMYEEGLRAYYRGDAMSAHRFFSAALAEDSTFAMAAFYDWQSRYWAALLGPDSNDQLARIVRLAARDGDRERLLISAMWADHVRSAALLPLADTLAIRFPLEPDGHYLLGRAYAAAGDFLRAVGFFERVVRMDSVGFGGASLRCRACDAMAEIVASYSLADSVGAAERAARRWTRLQPGAARPWVYLASQLEYQGRFEEALDARRLAMPFQPANRVDPVYPAIIAMRRGDYAAADRLLVDRLNSSSLREQRSAAWFLNISLRQQGRHTEALDVARAYADTLGAAVALMESGSGGEAARTLRSMAWQPVPDEVRPLHASWLLVHAASAHAAAGDFAVLPALADSIETLAANSAYARNMRLARYVRGRALAAAGWHEEAVREFELAVYSTSNGYGLLNLHHARSLIALGRARDAIAVLQAPFRGPVDAGNVYASHTELRLELGRAFELAGMPDSAAVQYRAVIRAWRQADPHLHARRDSVANRLQAVQSR